MFNGIIKKTGKIKIINKKGNNCYLQLITNIKFKKNDIGMSLSCSGACLTLERYYKNLAEFYISKETLRKTIFKFSKRGDLINLEKPLKYGEPISGHFVQGHIDTTSTIKKITILGKSWIIDFNIQKKFKKFVVEKGSITINGVSLTISNLLSDGFQVSVIPKTLQLTNLINLKKKDRVNVEFDVLGKYIQSLKK